MQQIDLGTGADMTDDFGSAQTADLAADGEGQAAGQPAEKAAGVEIAGSSGVDDLCYWGCGDAVLGAVGEDYAARGTAGERSDRDMAAHGRGGGGEVLGLVQRADLGLIGEENVDM